MVVEITCSELIVGIATMVVGISRTSLVAFAPPPSSTVTANWFSSSVALDASRSLSSVDVSLAPVFRYAVTEAVIARAPVKYATGILTVPRFAGVRYVRLFAIVMLPPVYSYGRQQWGILDNGRKPDPAMPRAG